MGYVFVLYWNARVSKIQLPFTTHTYVMQIFPASYRCNTPWACSDSHWRIYKYGAYRTLPYTRSQLKPLEKLGSGKAQLRNDKSEPFIWCWRDGGELGDWEVDGMSERYLYDKQALIGCITAFFAANSQASQKHTSRWPMIRHGLCA